jgi:hypothetical protein
MRVRVILRAAMAAATLALALHSAGSAAQPEPSATEAVDGVDLAAPPAYLDPALVPLHDSPVHLDTPPLAAPWPSGGPGAPAAAAPAAGRAAP